ncbi:hypothetical protein F2Q69_00046744, partial [Brassica cretica]
MSREDSLATVVLRFTGTFPGELHSGCRRKRYTVDLNRVLQLLTELSSQPSSFCFPSPRSETAKLPHVAPFYSYGARVQGNSSSDLNLFGRSSLSSPHSELPSPLACPFLNGGSAYHHRTSLSTSGFDGHSACSGELVSPPVSTIYLSVDFYCTISDLQFRSTTSRTLLVTASEPKRYVLKWAWPNSFIEALRVLKLNPFSLSSSSVSWNPTSQFNSVFAEMARSRSISGSGVWKYLNPAYYLRRPRRLALLFFLFVSVSMVVWDRMNLAREHEVCFCLNLSVQEILLIFWFCSFYEYLLKVWVQGNKTSEVKLYREMWEKSMKGLLSLIKKSTPSSFTYIQEKNGNSYNDKMDELACFAPGMLALGASGYGPDEEKKFLTLAEELAWTCYNFYQSTPTKLAGENYYFSAGQDMSVGTSWNILRPETVESLFYLWRLTGNKTYQEWGWNIFQAFEKNSRIESGYVGLKDVNTGAKDNKMQSFFLAETLKYLYLLFSPSSVISLDEWVFNTEAHPLKIVARNNDQRKPTITLRQRRFGGEIK